MKTLLLILSIMGVQAMACEPKNILVIGQSNAANLSQLDLATKWGETDCPATIFTSVRGGTGISAFTPNWSTASLYGRTTKAIEAAGVQLDAIVFWQGENDAKNVETAVAWSGLATQTIQSYRLEYGKAKNIPVFIFALNDKHPLREEVTPYWNHIRNWQFSMERKGITVIDSSAYEFKPDNVHLTWAGYTKSASDLAVLLQQCEGGV